MESKSKVPGYEGTMEVRNGVQGRSCARQGEKNGGNIKVITEDTCLTNGQLSALNDTKRNGLTIASQQKRNPSGNDASGPGGLTTGLAIDWDIVVFESGVGGEGIDEGREGVHLGVLRGLRRCRRRGMRWM